MNYYWFLLALITWIAEVMSSNLDEVAIEQIMDHHNKIRSLVSNGDVADQPSASNMRKLEWNDELAQSAEAAARRCHWEDDDHNFAVHDREESNDILDIDFRTDLLVEKSIAQWFSEHKNFRFPDKCDGTSCTSYIQMITAETSMVGCGIENCQGPSRRIAFVCKYNKKVGPNHADAYKIGDACSACPLVEAPLCVDSLCMPLEEEEPSILSQNSDKKLFCATGLEPQPSSDNPTQPQRCIGHHIFGSGDCKRGYSCQKNPFHEKQHFCCPRGLETGEIEQKTPLFCPNYEPPEFFEGADIPKLCRIGGNIVSSCSKGFICTKNLLKKHKFYCCPPNAGVKLKQNYCGRISDKPETDKLIGGPKVCNPAIWDTCSPGFTCRKADETEFDGRYFCCPKLTE